MLGWIALGVALAGVAASIGCLVLLAMSGQRPCGVMRRWLLRRCGDFATSLTVAVMPWVGCPFAASGLTLEWLIAILPWSAVMVTDFLAGIWPRIRRSLSRGGTKGRAVLARMLSRLKPAPSLHPKPVPA